jgi:hypothetical protein
MEYSYFFIYILTFSLQVFMSSSNVLPFVEVSFISKALDLGTP